MERLCLCGMRQYEERLGINRYLPVPKSSPSISSLCHCRHFLSIMEQSGQHTTTGRLRLLLFFFSVFSLSSLPFSLPVLYSSYALLYNVITGPKNVTIFCAPFSTLSSSRYFVFFLSLFLNKHKSINRIKGWKLKGLKKRSNTKLSQRCRKLVVRRQKYVEREKVAAHAAPLTVSGRVSFRSAAMQRA